MSQNDIDKMNLAAEDLSKIEQQIQLEVDEEFPYLSSEERRSIVESRVKMLYNKARPKLVKVDLGFPVSKKVKDSLFE
jgi:hypothetical protein